MKKGENEHRPPSPVELPEANEARAKLEKIAKRTKDEQRKNGKTNRERTERNGGIEQEEFAIEAREIEQNEQRWGVR